MQQLSGGGSGDLLLEDHADGTIGKFLDSASHETDTLIRFELENEVGHLLAEDDDNQVSDTFFILNQDSSPNIPYELEAIELARKTNLKRIYKSKGAKGLQDKIIKFLEQEGADDNKNIAALILVQEEIEKRIKKK